MNLPPYKILQSNSTSALEILVEVDIAQGYTPIGALAVSWDPRANHLVYVQAMILRTLEDPAAHIDLDWG